uniref:Leucine-rich repeat-containing N-terminal plant-type domain-containing protein n=1 Tax=Oryza rufipogon TaxID=4529 RepID=A0A0E0QZX2_ORYRU
MQVVNGSKVMLMASQGLHQGDGPITKNSSVPAPSTRRASNVKEAQIQKSDTNVSKIRPERWKATGIIALSDSSLKQSVAVVSISFPPLQRPEPGQIQEEEGSTRVSSRLVSSSSAISKEEEGQIQEEEEGKRKEGSTRIPGSGRLEGNVATAGIIFLLFPSFSPALSSSLAPNSLLQDLRCSGSSGQAEATDPEPQTPTTATDGAQGGGATSGGHGLSASAAVPEEVWGCGSSIRVLDVSNNCIEAIPQEIAALRSLQKLILTANDIADGNISWEGLTCVQTLTVLSLSQNRTRVMLGQQYQRCQGNLSTVADYGPAGKAQLVTLPSSLGSITHLRELRIANNRLENLPVEIGLLKHLEILIANNNRITSLPSSIGGCESLNEVDLSSNHLAELPEAFGNLQHLKALSVRNNGLTSLPSAFFIKCSQLITLDLHGTEITNDVLRQVDGWEEFDERRRKKHQKQLDFRVGSSGVFDEGADDDYRRL